MDRLMFIAALAAVLLGLGCSGMKVDQFEKNVPTLEFEQFFEGRVRGWGQLYSGNSVSKEFTVHIHGHWQGETLVMDEDFLFSDGRRVKRAWKVTKTGPDQYRAEADDVPGAARGVTKGNAIVWEYPLSLEKFSSSSLTVQCEDWLFRQSETIMLNRLTMRKLGFKVGEMILVMEKIE